MLILELFKILWNFMLVTCVSMEPFIWFQLVLFYGIDVYIVHLIGGEFRI